MGDHLWPALYPGLVVGLLFGLTAGGLGNVICATIGGLIGAVAAMFLAQLIGLQDDLATTALFVLLSLVGAAAAVVVLRILRKEHPDR